MESSIEALIKIFNMANMQRQPGLGFFDVRLATQHNDALIEIKNIAGNTLQSIRKGMRGAGIKEI